LRAFLKRAGVVRYDTAHGFAHKDVALCKGSVEKERIPFDDYNLAPTFAESDLRKNWGECRRKFLMEAGEDG
jgi:hypothetical protein